jgi:hypothetical protein
VVSTVLQAAAAQCSSGLPGCLLGLTALTELDLSQSTIAFGRGGRWESCQRRTCQTLCCQMRDFLVALESHPVTWQALSHLMKYMLMLYCLMCWYTAATLPGARLPGGAGVSPVRGAQAGLTPHSKGGGAGGGNAGVWAGACGLLGHNGCC